jgi:hypothetical protein
LNLSAGTLYHIIKPAHHLELVNRFVAEGYIYGRSTAESNDG